MLVTKIKEYREQAGYKQSELAELVGTRRETIVHLENGRYNPSLKLAMSIAKVFHVTVEDLFEFVDEEVQEETSEKEEKQEDTELEGQQNFVGDK